MKAALADKDCPPGCVRMPESERLATLNDLNTNKREIMTMLEKMRQWMPPDHWRTITTIDAHTGGEPFRIITGGLPGVPGDTILQRRRYATEQLDHLRTALMWEPRGHADMYGTIIGSIAYSVKTFELLE